MRTSFFVSVAFLIIACASSKPSGEPPLEVQSTGTPGEASATRSQKLTATVLAVDTASRKLTVQREDGSSETINVPPAVKRLDEIAAGDKIEVDVQEGILFQYQPPGSAFVEPAVAVGAARAGATEAPAGAVAGAIQSTVTIIGVDTKSRIVQFQDPDGNKYEVKAGPKLAIEKLKVGDRLLATYAATVAISLDKKPKM
jgi:hypothetical protein